MHAYYKKTHVKQYFKDNRALRTETTINDPGDVFVNKSLKHLGHLKDIGQQVNRKLLEKIDSAGKATGPLLYRLFYCQRKAGDPKAEETLGRALEQLESEASSA